MDKNGKMDTFDEIDALHKRSQQIACEYEEITKTGDFSLACPYQEIIEIYDEIMKKIVDYDGWGFDSNNNYQVYEANHFNIQQEFRRKVEEDRKLRERGDK